MRLKKLTGWRIELALIGVILLASVCAELLFGDFVLVLILGAASYVARHLLNLWQLQNLLTRGEKTSAFFLPGVWSVPFEQASSLHGQLQEQKQKNSATIDHFHNMLAGMPEAVVILGPQEEVVWNNPAAANLLGLTWPPATSLPLREKITHPIFYEYLEKGDFSNALELESPINSTVILSILLIDFTEGKDERLLIATDVTQVYHLDRIRKDFVTNVSHELRTPLTVITGMLEPLAQGMKSDQQSGQQWGRSVELMQQQAQRMKAIIEDLLNLSRLDKNDYPTSDETVEVASMISTIVNDARGIATADRHEFFLEVEEDLGLVGETKTLHSAFSNLIFNAVCHTPPRTKITVRWRRSGDLACFEVQDTGEGIAARHIPRLTERFYRVEAGRSRESGGTGLGLAIVNRVLIRHGCELRVISEPGNGSSFQCLFPTHRVTTIRPQVPSALQQARHSTDADQ